MIKKRSDLLLLKKLLKLSTSNFDNEALSAIRLFHSKINSLGINLDDLFKMVDENHLHKFSSNDNQNANSGDYTEDGFLDLDLDLSCYDKDNFDEITITFK